MLQQLTIKTQSVNTSNIGNGWDLHRVAKSCYFGDVIGADGGVDSTIIASESLSGEK